MNLDTGREVWCLTADLRTPVASADPYIHLDGLVAYAVSRELGYTADDFEDGGPPEYFIDDMPLRRYRHTNAPRPEDEWVWAASAGAIGTVNEEQSAFDVGSWDSATAAKWFETNDPSDTDYWSTTRWRQHFDHDSCHQAKNTQINISSGPFKSYNAALPYAAADSLTFFFEPAPKNDAEYVRDLLESHVSAIGKKRTQGYGSVRGYELHEATGAVSSALAHGERTLRSLPASWFERVVEGIIYGQRTTRPPYWHADNQTMAVAPYAALTPELIDDSVKPHRTLAEVTG